jgi:hypothetical protein
MSNLDITRLGTGYAQAAFEDVRGEECWLAENQFPEEGEGDGIGEPLLYLGICNHRMTLNKAMVKALLPLLRDFVEKDCIGEKGENQ